MRGSIVLGGLVLGAWGCITEEAAETGADARPSPVRAADAAPPRPDPPPDAGGTRYDLDAHVRPDARAPRPLRDAEAPPRDASVADCSLDAFVQECQSDGGVCAMGPVCIEGREHRCPPGLRPVAFGTCTFDAGPPPTIEDVLGRPVDPRCPEELSLACDHEGLYCAWPECDFDPFHILYRCEDGHWRWVEQNGWDCVDP